MAQRSLGTRSIAAIAVGVAMVSVTGVADAADGGNLLLGRSNTASRTSVLTDTTGTALSLNSPAGKAPLAVSNGVKVRHLNADRLDGLDSTGLQPRFTRTVVVSPKATPQASGTALRNAIASITTADAANPFLVKLEPGVYDVVGMLELPSNIALEGSGRDNTTITSVESRGLRGANNTPTTLDATLLVHSATAVRSLLVQNTAAAPPGHYVSALIARGDKIDLEHLTLQASGKTSEVSETLINDGVNFATDVRAAGGADTVASITVFALSGTLEFVGGRLLEAHAPAAFSIASFGGVVHIADSEVISATTGTQPTCFNDYDKDFTALTAACG